jgi:rubrerythrin
MSKDQTLEILKRAILLEMQGKSFYEGMAEATKSEGVKRIFTIMAEEEEQHKVILSKKFHEFQSTGAMEETLELGSPESFADTVLSEQIRKEIGAAGYEAAGIGAAIELEKKAVALYEEQARKAGEGAAGKLFRDLALWERSHMTFLSELYDDLIEASWNEADFWPF